VADDGSLTKCHDLVFWGEWEAPSYVIRRWEPADTLPRFLHRPVWERPAPNGIRQNTDPWVFGNSFIYSNCRQLTPNHNRSALQRLTPGSLILFGSTIDAEFVIDTAFVVGDKYPPCPFSPGKPPETDEAFRVCTVESLQTTGNHDDPFILYRGATYKDPFNGMYSFVPCRRTDTRNMRFSRPSISLGRYVNPKNWRAARGATTRCSQADVRRQWESVRKQVFDAGCLLGVWFATPQLDKDSTAGASAEIGQVNVTGPKGCGQT
jgi:hypothetical protein